MSKETKYSQSRTRWYNRDGEIINEMPNADGSGMTNTTLRHARKHGFLPSVTSVIDILARHSLIDWQIEQAIKAAASFPFAKEPTEANLDDYIGMIKAKANEFKDHTADIGKEIHKDIELFFTEGKVPSNPVSIKAVGMIKDEFDLREVVEVTNEWTLASPRLGYAGTLDILTRNASGKRILWDVKTKDLAKYKKTYESELLQLSAYDDLVLDTCEDEEPAQLINIIVDRNAGDTIFEPHKRDEFASNAFRHLFETWVCLKKYDPRKEIV